MHRKSLSLTLSRLKTTVSELNRNIPFDRSQSQRSMHEDFPLDQPFGNFRFKSANRRRFQYLYVHHDYYKFDKNAIECIMNACMYHKLT